MYYILQANKFKYFSESFNKTGGNTNTLALIILLLVIILFVLYLIIYNYFKKKYNLDFSRKNYLKKHNFYSLGKSADLTQEETKHLYNIVIKQKIKYPLTCFTNAKLLDEIIKNELREIERYKNKTNEERTNESAIILEIKAKIEKSLRDNTGIRTTHLIIENQKMVIFVRNRGYFYATVLKNINEFLIIQLISKKIIKRVFSELDYLKIYFWREEDAGYIFESHIVGYGDDIKTYYIKHSDNLIRSQKRKYRRVPVNINGDIYPMETKIINKKKKYILAGGPQIKCNIKNLSAGGLMMVSENIKTKNNIIKIVFTLNRYEVSTIGKIIRVHNFQDNLYEMTVQFLKMLLKDKNVINKYVYNYLPEFE